tara:strand:- start:230 stop:352 length:123 start_codon:yes stop_codon:yes gene_type:complete
MKTLIWALPLAFIMACGDKDEDTGTDTGTDTAVDSAEGDE